MKGLFSLDNPFIQFLTKVGEMIIANFLFLVCCLPVFTVGASLTALQKVTQDIVFDETHSILKTFFRAFADNFKQATLCWLAILVFLVGMGCNLMLTVTYLTGILATVVKTVLAILVLLVVSGAVYLFPLIVRYDNTIREHVINSGVLALIKLPRTVVMVLVTLLPLIIMYFSMVTFFSTLVFWLVLGFAFSSYICSTMLAPVFKELEKGDTSNMSIMN